ncbi:hypothetical protein [Spiroplasma endosymbiont of Labia minor]|uniref:hypothetical protein n=1 Tax=Spiroplasma endosymbiont of Labia minor TaxID=3066305 RepID=UPI0030D25FEB
MAKIEIEINIPLNGKIFNFVDKQSRENLMKEIEKFDGDSRIKIMKDITNLLQNSFKQINVDLEKIK